MQKLLKAFQPGIKCSLLLEKVPLLSRQEFNEHRSDICIGLDTDAQKTFQLAAGKTAWQKSSLGADYEYTWLKCPYSRAAALYWDRPIKLSTLRHDSGHFHISCYHYGNSTHPWVAESKVVLYTSSGEVTQWYLFRIFGATEIAARAELEHRLQTIGVKLYKLAKRCKT